MGILRRLTAALWLGVMFFPLGAVLLIAIYPLLFAWIVIWLVTGKNLEGQLLAGPAARAFDLYLAPWRTLAGTGRAA